jgi:CRP-like cAMP-binding protein
MSSRLSEIGRRLLSNPSTSGGQRLARLLLELAERHGVATDGGMTITLPMSQQELASWVDTSRETAARALKDWRARGLVRTARCRITVIDVPALSKIAASGPADGVPPAAGRRSSYD